MLYLCLYLINWAHTISHSIKIIHDERNAHLISECRAACKDVMIVNSLKTVKTLNDTNTSTISFFVNRKIHTVLFFI